MPKSKLELDPRLDEKIVHKIVCADSAEALRHIPDDSVQLVLTSPPYNIGKVYEQDQRLSLDEYLDWVRPIIEALSRKVTSTGSVCWQVGNYVKSGEVFPLDLYFYEIFRQLGFKLRNRIIWRFNFGLHATARFSGRYETILWFTKTDDYVFNLDPIRVPQIYPGKRHSSAKGEKAGTPSGNKLGKNPSNYWEFSAQEAFVDNPVWDMPNVKANHPEKTVHPCQFPTELAERCILAFTNNGDLVLDPFVGAGTTVIAAAKNQRRSVGIDKDEQYAELARARLKSFYEGSLRLRPSGKPVRGPKSGEKVSSIPDEWLESGGN